MAVINLYNLLQIDNTLFDDYELDTRIDRELVTMEIVRRCGELRPYYSTTYEFKFWLASFFRAQSYAIKTLYDSTMQEYNPIENYNRTETITRDRTIDRTNTDNGTLDRTITDNGTITQTGESEQNGSGNINGNTHLDFTDENEVSAFNAGTYQPSDKKTHVENATNNSDNTSKLTNTTSSDSKSTNNTSNNAISTNTNVGKDTEDETITNNAKGNIGVTTTQQMLEQERRIAEFSIYSWIARKVEDNFFVCVY